MNFYQYVAGPIDKHNWVIAFCKNRKRDFSQSPAFYRY